MTEEIHTTATSDRFVNRTHPLHICIWGSNHMDGQKSIWLQQVAHMDKTKLFFTWVMTTSEDVREGAGVRERLMQIPGTRVMDSPLASHPLKIVNLKFFDYSFLSSCKVMSYYVRAGRF